MNGIVNYNLQKAQPVSLSTGYKEKEDPYLGALPQDINSLTRASTEYSKEATKAAEAGRAMEYEKAVADLVSAAETLEMTDVQKTQALEKFQVQFADVDPTVRNSIDNRYSSLGVAQDLNKKRAEAELQSQIDYEKALDEEFQKTYPTWAVTMSPEERKKTMKQITFTAGSLAQMLSDPDVDQTTNTLFQETLTQIEFLEVKNWLVGKQQALGEGAKVSVQSLANDQYQLTQMLASRGVDIRVATKTSDIYFKPLIAVAEEFGKTSEISLAALDRNAELSQNPFYRYLVKNPNVLSYLDDETKRLFDLITLEGLTLNVQDLLLTQGGLQKLDGNSYKLGFTQLSGANYKDDPLQALSTVAMSENLRKQQNNSNGAADGSSYREKADAWKKMSPQDRLNAMANDRGLLEAFSVMFNEYSQSDDADVKRAAKDSMINKMQDSLAYSLGVLEGDLKGFWTHNYTIKWVLPGELRLYNASGDDITEGFSAAYWGAGNPQAQLKNNVAELQEIAKGMSHLGATPQEVAAAMNEVIEDVFGADGKIEVIGTAEDIGNAALDVPGAFNDLVKPVVDLIVPEKKMSTAAQKETQSADIGQEQEALELTNPGNIKASKANAWEGKTGQTYEKSGNSFEIFESPEMGFRAMFKLLETYKNKYGADTIEKIIARWDEGNENYIKDLEQNSRIARDEAIDLRDKEKMVSLVYQMALLEKGIKQWKKYSREQVAAGYDLAFPEGSLVQTF